MGQVIEYNEGPGIARQLILQVTIEGLPKTTNATYHRHYMVVAKEAREWKNLVAAHLNSEINKSRAMFSSFFLVTSMLPMKKAKLTLTRHSSSEPDFDGLASSFKHVIDGIVQAGVIVNDKMSVIGQPTYQWKKARPKCGFITVRIESVD